MVASQARPAYIYDTTLEDWVPMSGVVDTGQAYTFTANQTFNGLVTANNGINATSTLSLQTGGVNRLSIDSSGRVIKPYQPIFRATKSVNAGSGVVVFDLTTVNVGNNYSTSTGRFTAPVSGTYWISVTALPATGTGGFYQIRKNGTAHMLAYAINGDETVTISGAISLSINDYIDVNIGTDGFEAAYSWFSGMLVG